ncbi:hypothetical protein CLV68_3170 [Actinokineospora cianjurensis]|uniref:Uncharacterized protein n=1 Tax=Actinokineospora cianjurensis TaxID=585224 RepID=A0A421B2U3_9PSEU|nr:hypothetical protein CLV68_3170 [Actinokineospora cianjurensis]
MPTRIRGTATGPSIRGGASCTLLYSDFASLSSVRSLQTPYSENRVIDNDPFYIAAD